MLKVNVIWGIVFNLNEMLLLFGNLVLCEWTCLGQFLFLFLNLWGIHWSVWLGYRLSLCYWCSMDMVSSLLDIVCCTSHGAHIRWRWPEYIGALKTILCSWCSFDAIRQEMIDAIDIGAAFCPSKGSPRVSLINTYQALVFQHFKQLITWFQIGKWSILSLKLCNRVGIVSRWIWNWAIMDVLACLLSETGTILSGPLSQIFLREFIPSLIISLDLLNRYLIITNQTCYHS